MWIQDVKQNVVSGHNRRVHAAIVIMTKVLYGLYSPVSRESIKYMTFLCCKQSAKLGDSGLAKSLGKRRSLVCKYSWKIPTVSCDFISRILCSISESVCDYLLHTADCTIDTML